MPEKEMKIPDDLSIIQPTQGEEIDLNMTIHTVDITAQKQKKTYKKPRKMMKN